MNARITQRTSIKVLAFLGTIAATNLALAQDAVAQENAAEEISAADAYDGDIVVTARRRAEPLQKTPLAVTALSSMDIEASAGLSIVDLGKSMPNVRIDSLGSMGRAGMLSIRGVNYARSDQAGDPSTAFYIDGLYQSRSTLNVLDMFDVESIEVLRGPQGTLFGRNAFAGAVNIQSKRPEMDFGAKGEVRIGNYGRSDFRGSVNVPLVEDTLAVRASLLYSKSDGYYKDINNNGKHIGGDDNITGRLSMLFTPSNDWTIFAKYEHVRDRGDPTPIQNASTTAEDATAALPAQVLGTIPGDAPNISRGRYWSTTPTPGSQRHFVDQDNFVLNIGHDIDGGSISSITGYQNSRDGLVTGIAGDIIYTNNYYRTKVQMFSQEMRFMKEIGDSFQILAGGYYSFDHLKYGAITYSEYDALLSSNAQVNAKQKRDSWALFLELEARPIEDVRINIAGRQMWEDKDFSFTRQLRPTDTDLDPGLFLPVAGYSRDKSSWNNFSPKISVDWSPSNDVMLYGSWSKGFKSGGYAVLTTNITLAGPYEPEEIETYEVGIKTFFFDRKLKANVTLFWNNLDNLQRSITNNINGVPSNRVFNAASAVTKGVEVELEGRITPDLRLRASGGYLKANYKDFCANFTTAAIPGFPAGEVCGTEAGARDFSSFPLYNAPKWQAALGGSYQIDAGNIGSFTFNADVNYTSSLYTNDLPWPVSRRGAMTVVDSTLQWKAPDDRFYGSLFVQNLFNEIDTQQGIRSGNTQTVFNYTAPRRYGMTLGVKF